MQLPTLQSVLPPMALRLWPRLPTARMPRLAMDSLLKPRTSRRPMSQPPTSRRQQPHTRRPRLRSAMARRSCRLQATLGLALEARRGGPRAVMWPAQRRRRRLCIWARMPEACLHTRVTSTFAPAIRSSIPTLPLLSCQRMQFLPTLPIWSIPAPAMLLFVSSVICPTLTPSPPCLVQVAVLRSSGRYTVGRVAGVWPGWVRVEVDPSGAFKDVPEDEALRLLSNLRIS